jgi:hypothetical protein
MKRIDKSLEADPTVQKAVAQGYEIRYSYQPDAFRLDFQLLHGGQAVGQAVFTVMPSQQVVQAELADVQPEHRRRGLASAIYVCAEKITGCTLIPGANQTEDGKAFWDRLHRP